jgi:hypothetical protein
MAGVDLGKQVGPLPLGAWVAVVGTGVGIAVYQRRATAPADPTIVDDTSGTPGVGVGGSGQWVNVDPPTGSTGDPVPTTNEEWAVKAINYLIAHNYNPAQADSAIRKYIAGSSDQLSVSEWALVTIALGALKSPPSPLPPSSTPPTTTPPPVATPAAGHKYVRELHRIARKESGRSIVTRFSTASVATPNNVETALKKTVADVGNLRYRAYYGRNGGTFPAGAAVYVTTVKRK